MTSVQPNHAEDPPAVVVAGHICLDIIPQLPSHPAQRMLRPGALDLIGPVTLAVGGCAGNTGIALHRLGLRASLVARVGDDQLGSVLTDLVHRAVPTGAARLVATAGEMTSYSLLFNRPGQDRSIAHFPGVNDTFVAEDVPSEMLQGATLLHIGYPPLMAALVADNGRELALLLAMAHERGVATSLDMANANLGPGEGQVRWRELLERVLPDVDIFLPSLLEACHLLGRRIQRDERGAPTLASVGRIADELVEMGVGIAGVKLGEHGLYIRTGSAARIAAVPKRLAATWAARELYSTVFETHVVGTAGAGDTTIAGFLFGLLTGMSPGDTVTAACAVGGSSTEAADGTSSVPGWPDVKRRLESGWRRRTATPGPGWSPSDDLGLWYGPRDAQGSTG